MGHVGIGGEEDNDSLILFTAQHSKEANAIKEWQGYPVEVIVVGRAKPALV